MNVIAADMCTNARRVRKRWLPKIQSLLPDSLPPPSCLSQPRKAKRGGQGGDAPQPAGGLPEPVAASCHEAPPTEPHPREEAGDGEAARREEPLPHLQFAGARGGAAEEALMGGDAEGRLQTGHPPPSSPPDTGPAPSPHLPDTDHKGAGPVEHSQS